VNRTTGNNGIDEDGGGPQIFLTTNGYIQADELHGNMLVGHIHSTENDVTLNSGSRILDADSATTVDVSAMNITLNSGVVTGADADADGLTPGGLVIPTGVSNPTAGGIGQFSDFLEINVDRNDDTIAGYLDAFDINASNSHDGIYIDELNGDLTVGLVHTIENVSLRTVGGSILDATADITNDDDVRGQSIDLDANGGSIGEFGNDLEIDSSRGSNPACVNTNYPGCADPELTATDPGLAAANDDVALEATQHIYLTETDAYLRLVLAHAVNGEIRITVRESADLDEDLFLIENGSARFAESGGKRHAVAWQRSRCTTQYTQGPDLRRKRQDHAASWRQPGHTPEQRDPRQPEHRHLR